MKKFALLALSGFLVVQSVPPPADLFALIQGADPDLAPGQGINVECVGRDSRVHDFSIWGQEPISTFYIMSTSDCRLPPGYGRPE